jgi:hypothetical protein
MVGRPAAGWRDEQVGPACLAKPERALLGLGILACAVG